MFKLLKKTAIAVLVTTTAASAANYATDHPVPAGPAYKVMYQAATARPADTHFTLPEQGDYFRASRRKQLRPEGWHTPPQATIRIVG